MTVDRNNITRVPGSMVLPDGDKKKMLLLVQNLKITADEAVHRQFIAAVNEGDLEAIRECINLGVDADDADAGGNIPLCIAAQRCGCDQSTGRAGSECEHSW
jgi:hypothetical protein